MSALHCKIALEERLDLHVALLVNERGKYKPFYTSNLQRGSVPARRWINAQIRAA